MSHKTKHYPVVLQARLQEQLLKIYRRVIGIKRKVITIKQASLGRFFQNLKQFGSVEIFTVDFNENQMFPGSSFICA